jgi:hypothetical protein
MVSKKLRIAFGVSQLDRLLGGLFIGDNVVWYDDAGSLVAVFHYHLFLYSITEEFEIVVEIFNLILHLKKRLSGKIFSESLFIQMKLLILCIKYFFGDFIIHI